MMHMNQFSDFPAVAFGRAQLDRACGKLNVSVDYTLQLDPALPQQSYLLSRDGQALFLRAGDEEGALHALLDLADSIEAHGGEPVLPEGLQTPYILNRGIKLNVPLDARTPSYTDCGDSAQDNIVFMWDEGFWQGLLDRMALQRYNALTLWNLCPFPSMVRVPEYPDAALNDVMISSFMAGGTSRALRFYTPEMKENLVRVRKMTIDEKTAFWHRVFRYAADRCVKVYLFTWNLYLYGLEDSGYALSELADDPETRRYIRCSVKALLREYPSLAGIGVTAGENLCPEWTETQDMHWVRDTYGRAVEEILSEDPDRDLTLICRTHQTTLPLLTEAFADFRGKLELSSKYAMAHMTATEKPHFSDALFAQKAPGMGVWLTLRQDEFYLFPWADDEFLSSFMEQLPRDDLRGFYLGSDGIIWGIENQSRSPDLQNRYWVDKHFAFFALVGRLGLRGYVDGAERKLLMKKLAPGFPSEPLLRKMRHASHAVRLVSLTHWHPYDFQWYPEACCCLNEPDTTTVFLDLNEFLRCGACPEAGAASAAETARREADGKRTALDVAAEMLKHADLADAIALPEGSTPAERELRADLNRITGLTRYYAFKFRAAVLLLRGQREEARRNMRQAADYWRRYADETARWYRPQRLSRLRGVVSPDMWVSRAERDVWICENGRDENVCIDE